MKTMLDSLNYFAKAGTPGNPWRTPPQLRCNAIADAKKFVRDWRDNGLDTFAVVFYRDGSVVETITTKNCD